jgi:proteasome lid subunit RPN8/RPN11
LSAKKDKKEQQPPMSTTEPLPDVSRLQSETLPAADFPAGTKQDFRVFFNPGVHAQIWKHASEDTSLEICGVVVGLWQRDAAGPYAVISEFIRCDSAKSGFAEVTFTHESWNKINAEMDSKFTNLKIIGWYHSHPNFGIFLSDRDVFIHQHFFSGPGQIAHVVDPVRKIDGVFAWRDGKPELSPHFWVGDKICVTPDLPAEKSPAGGMGGTVAAEAYPRAAGQQSSSWMAMFTNVALMVSLFLLGFLLAGRMTNLERRLERERDLMGLVAYFAEHKVLRPGLDENLTTLGVNLHAVATVAKKLEESAPKSDSEADEALRTKWKLLLEGLDEVEQQMKFVHQQGMLTADDERVVQQMMRELFDRAPRREKSERRSASDTDDAEKLEKRGSEPKRKSEPSRESEKVKDSRSQPTPDKKPAPDKKKPPKED